jgi:hypothetical protein
VKKNEQKVEEILELALENLLLINHPDEARKHGLRKLHKLDISYMHYIHQCAVLKIFRDQTSSSERKLAIVFGISKSEIHRMLEICKIPSSVRKKAMDNDVEKWVLVKMSQPNLREAAYAHMVEGVLSGRITQYAQVKGLR